MPLAGSLTFDRAEFNCRQSESHRSVGCVKQRATLYRLNLSPELWLQTIAGFAKRRSTNSLTPASRFNAAANTSRMPITSDGYSLIDRRPKLQFGTFAASALRSAHETFKTNDPLSRPADATAD